MTGLLNLIAKIPPILWFLIAGGYGYYYWDSTKTEVITPKIAEIEQKKAEVQKIKAAIKRGEEFAKVRDQKAKEREELQERFQRALEKIPKNAELPKLIKLLASLSDKVGLVMNSIQPGVPKAEEFLTALPIEVSLKGSYGQVMSYLDAVSGAKRVVAPKILKLSNPKPRGSTSVVEAQVTFEAYTMETPPSGNSDNQVTPQLGVSGPAPQAPGVSVPPQPDPGNPPQPNAPPPKGGQ